MKNIKNISKNNKLKDTYPILNIIFAGIIILIFIYSGVFSSTKENYPIKCAHFTATGEPCETCGLSRSFTEIMHFNFEKAKTYNRNGIPLFLFFLTQLIIRLTGLILYLTISKHIPKIIILDIIISIVIFMLTFRNLMF